ncbi:MAG: protoporphyrinogen oxidase [bacterium]
MSDHLNNHLYDVCIIGAGITGLTLAYRLKKAGLQVAVLEKQPRAGGVIRTETFDGFLFDQGPNSTLTKTPQLETLIDEIGLRERVCFANDQASNRYILKHGRLCKLPMSPPAFLASNLLSWRGKLRIFAEPFIKPRREQTPESLADFVRRRLGQEALDYLVNPFIAGVYAGDPEKIDLQSALPRLAELERKHGGLIRGAIAKKRQSKAKELSTGPTGRLLSFDDGMHVLADTLAQKLNDVLIVNAAVTAIRQAHENVEVSWQYAQGKTKKLAARKLVLAAPAKTSADLLEQLSPEIAEALRKIIYAPVAVAFHGYQKAHIRNPLDGFGFLAPEKENCKILGAIWSSTIFPNRAPEGHAALTTFVGGARQPELAQKSENELFEIIEAELGAHLGVEGAPAVRKMKLWPKAIPQYGLQHVAILTQIEAFEKRHPGVRIAGNFRQGVSVGDCVDYAHALAQEIIEENHVRKPTQIHRFEDSQARKTAAALAAQ